MGGGNCGDGSIGVDVLFGLCMVVWFDGRISELGVGSGGICCDVWCERKWGEGGMELRLGIVMWLEFFVYGMFCMLRKL